jgi:6-phosphofructokinase 1
MYDDSAGLDSFGHKKLAGAGKYVAQEITRMLKADAEIKSFMAEQGMFVPGLYEIPEVRVIVPSHLVRSGFTSAYDANFGMEAGASAVCCLLNGITGVTVTGFYDGHIHYMDTKEAIKQRFIDLDQVTLYEQVGICFGRVREEFEPKFTEVSGMIQRIY